MHSKVLGPLLAALMTLVLAGCGERIELHRELSEQDANAVLAELADKRIPADKRLDKNGVTVLVPGADMSRAVRVLEAAGLPPRARTSLGDVFRKEGVISSPLEERARYLYALSQELEHTLSQIDAVVVARVHVVLPERIAPGEPVQPASAAVFIKHRKALDPDSVLPRIRRMVASSIPGMGNADDRKLAVVFVPSQDYRETVPMVEIGPLSLTRERWAFWQGLMGLCALAAALLLGGLLALNPDWRKRLLAATRGSAATPPAQP